MGPMISKGAKARAERLIQDSLDAGADVLLDGRYMLTWRPLRSCIEKRNRIVKRLRYSHHRNTWTVSHGLGILTHDGV